MERGGRGVGTLVALGWALALFCQGCGPLHAAPPPFSYLVTKVTAVGGHPVKEAKKGVIFERLGGCEIGTPPAPAKPLAGSLGDGVSLALEIRSCPGSAPAPTGHCRLRVGTGAEETFQVSGWQATLPVALPAATGIYPLSLRCTLSGQPEQRLESDLFVTYAKPVFPIVAPRADWYRLACAWGSGLHAGDPPAAGLEKILHGLYAHGQRNWRYGYCVNSGSLCVFGDTQLPFNSCDLNGGMRTCKWWLLAAGATRCNFTDCVGYSTVFGYLSSTFGVGVRAFPAVEGAKNEGFSTQGWLKALDPAAGNLHCGYRGLECAFLFGAHSLVQRDGVLYDATMGQTYRNTGELIAQNIVSKGAGVVTLDHSLACPLSRPAYGGFMYFREIPQGIEECTLNPNRPAYFLDTDPVVVPESVEGDERPEVLDVLLDVEVVVAGSYQVYGALFGGPDGTEPVVSRASHRAQNVFSSSHISGPPGKYKVTLSFSGEALARSAVPQPYWIDAAIVSEEGISDTTHRQLPRFSLEGLGEQAVRLGTVAEAEERRQPGQGTALRVSVPVEVRNAGTYAVATTLSSGGRTVSEVGFYRKLSPGPDTLAVDFPGEEIAREGLDGAYTVIVEVHGLDSQTGTPTGVVDALTEEIGSFQASDFGNR